MSTVEEKLRAAIASKEAISSAIIERGGTLTEGAPLSAYAGAVTSSLVNTDRATATAADLRVRRSAYTSGGRLIYGSILDATVTSGATTYEITSGYLASALSLERGGGGTMIDSELYIFNGGITANVDSTGGLVLYGCASATVQKNDGTIVLVESGCDYNGFTNSFYGIPSCFAPGGTAIINSGTMEIYTGNGDSNFCPKFEDVDNYGTLRISYSGYSASPTLYGAVINRSGGYVYAPASSIVNHDGGTVELGSGYVSSMTISGGSATLNETCIDGVDILGGSASMCFCSCATIQIFGGYLTLEQATGQGDFIMSGGSTYISGGIMGNFYISGGTADIGDISEACPIYVSGGALVNLWGSTGQAYISGGYVILTGSMTHGGRIENGTLDINEYGYTERFVVSGGTVNISSGGSAQLEVYDGNVTICSGGLARITGNSSCVTVEDGGSVEYW